MKEAKERQACRQAGRTVSTESWGGIELLRENLSIFEIYASLGTDSEEPRESTRDCAIDVKQTSTPQNQPPPPPVFSFTHADVWWVDLQKALSLSNQRKLFRLRIFSFLLQIFCALFSKGITFFEKKDTQNFPTSANNSTKILDKTKFFSSSVCFNFLFKLSCAGIKSFLSRVGAYEKRHEATCCCGTVGTRRAVARSASASNTRACAACSIYEQSRINHIQVIRTYSFGLSLSPIGCRFAMQKFAKAATASNFSSTPDITSRCDVPN